MRLNHPYDSSPRSETFPEGDPRDLDAAVSVPPTGADLYKLTPAQSGRRLRTVLDHARAAAQNGIRTTVYLPDTRVSVTYEKPAPAENLPDPASPTPTQPGARTAKHWG